jgi:phospholipid transport system substrate-binding protein
MSACNEDKVGKMVSFKYVVAMTVVLTACIVMSPVFAAEADAAPDMVVKSIAQDIAAAAKNDRELSAGDPKKLVEFADARLAPHFDFRRMTQAAMAKNWRLATPEQQDQLTREFRTLLISTYSRAITTYKDQRIEFRPVRAAGGEATVRSEILQQGQSPTVIDYDLAKSAEGWKIFDVKVGGASLVVTYRDTFADEVRNGGVDGLIAALANKNRANEARYKTVKS